MFLEQACALHVPSPSHMVLSLVISIAMDGGSSSPMDLIY